MRISCKDPMQQSTGLPDQDGQRSGPAARTAAAAERGMRIRAATLYTVRRIGTAGIVWAQVGWLGCRLWLGAACDVRAATRYNVRRIGTAGIVWSQVGWLACRVWLGAEYDVPAATPCNSVRGLAGLGWPAPCPDGSPAGGGWVRSAVVAQDPMNREMDRQAGWSGAGRDGAPWWWPGRAECEFRVETL